MINQNVKKGKQIRFEVKNRYLRPFCHRFDKKKAAYAWQRESSASTKRIKEALNISKTNHCRCNLALLLHAISGLDRHYHLKIINIIAHIMTCIMSLGWDSVSCSQSMLMVYHHHLFTEAGLEMKGHFVLVISRSVDGTRQIVSGGIFIQMGPLIEPFSICKIQIAFTGLLT